MRVKALHEKKEYTTIREMVEDIGKVFEGRVAYRYRKNPHDKEAIKVNYEELRDHVRAISTEIIARGLAGKKFVTAKDVFDAAKEGDKVAHAIVEEVTGILALGLSYISCVCDPEAFIIGGGVSKAGSILTDAIQRQYVDNVFGELKKTKFVLATLGNDAGIYGGAKLALGE